MAPTLRQLAPLFLASGAAALIFETTWLRWLRPLLGATAPAASAALVAFLAGNAVGAVLGARLARRRRGPRDALRLYGGLELGAAVGAALTPSLLVMGEQLVAARYDALLEAPAVLTALRFTVGVLATAPAAICLGATLPAIGAAGVPHASGLGARGSALYAVNLVGATAGVLLASFGLAPWLGVRGGYGVGLALSAGAGFAAWALAQRAPLDWETKDELAPGPTSRQRDPDPTPALRPSPYAAPSIAALSGFGAFAAQVLWIQSFALVLDQSVHAFGAVLAGVLASLAAGAAAVAGLHRRLRWPARALLGFALGLSALALLVFPPLFFHATEGLRVAPGGSGLARVAGVLWTAGPALLAIATVLPLTFALAGDEHGRDASPGWLLGRLAAANTAGSVAGALVAPFVLLPWLGPLGAFVAVALVYAVGALWLRDPVPARRRGRDALLAAGWIAAIVWANPLTLPLSPLRPDERLLDERSTAAGLVAVVERAGERLIRIDGHYALGGTAESRHEERQGHLPLVLHSAPERVAFVGTATGITAGAGLAHGVQSLRLVEIVPAVTDAARRWFATANRSVYDDARAEVAVDDARNHLRQTAARFDVVVSDLFVPWRAGVGELYSREHFAAVSERLTDDGLFCQWLPLYQLSAREVRIIAASFVDVFPDASLWRGDFYGAYPIVALVGWRGARPAPDAIEAAARRLADAGVEDRWVTDPVGVWSLYLGELDRAALAGVPRNSRDRPRIEHLAAAGHASGAPGPREPAVARAWLELAAELTTGTDGHRELSAEARRAVRGGAMLQRANVLYAEGRLDEAARTLEVAASLLPTRLLAEGTPDASAAELWFDR